MSGESLPLENYVLQSPAPRSFPPKLRSGEKFIDLEFPANTTSLIGPVRPSFYADEWEDLVWVRPAQISPELTGNLVPTGKWIKPFSVKTNLLANFSFAAAISILAETPELLSRLFQPEWADASGGYSVWLHTDGRWRCYFVDDQLPAIPRDMGKFELSFTQSKEGGLSSICVSILEKAYAKSLGCYAASAIGSVGAVLGDLTGVVFNTTKTQLIDETIIWQTAKGILKHGGVVSFFLRPTPAQAQNISQPEDGASGILLGGTACRVVSFAEETLADGRQLKLFRLRVSKGNISVGRLWASSELIWADNLQNRLGPVDDTQEHLIWLPVDVCKNTFDEFITGNPHVKQYHDSVKLPNPHQSVLIWKQTSKQPLLTEINLHQKDYRRVALTNSIPKYPFGRVTLLEVVQFGFRFITSKFAAGREISINQLLSQGDFVILVEQYFPAEANPPDSTLSIVIPEKVGSRLVSAPSAMGLFAATELEAWRSYVNTAHHLWTPQLRDEKQNQWKVYLHKDTDAYLQLEAIFNNTDPLTGPHVLYERTYTGKGVQFSENVFNGAAALRPSPQQVDLAIIKPNPLFADNEFVIGGFMPVVLPRVPDATGGDPQKQLPQLDNHFAKTHQQWLKILTDVSAAFESKMVDGEGTCGSNCTLI